MPKQAKRRFVGLSTEEVSLVDSPANEVEFLVLKNLQEEIRMGANAVVKKRVAVPVDDAGDEDAVSKALGHVSGIVDKIVGIVGTKKSADADDSDDDEADETENDDSNEEDESSDDDSDESSDDESTVDVEKGASLKSVLRKCGIEGAAMKTALIKLKAMGVDPEKSVSGDEKKAKGGDKGKGKGVFPFGAVKKPDPKGAKGKGKTKADDDEDEGDKKKTTKATEDEPLTFANFAEAVQKAAAFTPARITQLQNAQEILKIVLESVAPGTVPDTKVPVLDKHGNKSHLGVKKSADITVDVTKAYEITEALSQLAEAVGEMNERIESIEKARAGSNSVDADGTTETKTKKSGSLWSGVL